MNEKQESLNRIGGLCLCCRDWPKNFEALRQADSDWRRLWREDRNSSPCADAKRRFELLIDARDVSTANVRELVNLVRIHLPDAFRQLRVIRRDWSPPTIERPAQWDEFLMEAVNIEEAAGAAFKYEVQGQKVAASNAVAYRHEARDAWLNEQAENGIWGEKLRIKLDKEAKRKKWETIGSRTGVNNAVNKHRERHGLPPLPSRKRGSPPKKTR